MKEVLIAILTMIPACAHELQITVYDKAALPKPVIETTFDELNQIFRTSGISINVTLGDLTADEASLFNMTAKFQSRADEETARCRARRDIALDILRAPAGVRPTILGTSQPMAQTGLNVRMFADHIRDAAVHENRPYPTVLAHAIAHEIGHVLLKTNSHQKHGLMAAVWTVREYEWMAKNAMLFTGEQSETIRTTLAGCRSEDIALAHMGGTRRIVN